MLNVELRRKAKEAARARERQAAAASQDEADESDATEEGDRRENDESGSGTTARWHGRLQRESARPRDCEGR